MNAPEVNPSNPTKPDDCDTAVIEIPSGVNVCDPDTGKIIDVPKDQEDKYLPADSDKCKDKVVVCDPETGKVVTVIEGQEGKYLPADNDKCRKERVVATVELPKTGPAEIAVQIVGAMQRSLASSYYMASRRLIKRLTCSTQLKRQLSRSTPHRGGFRFNTLIKIIC